MLFIAYYSVYLIDLAVSFGTITKAENLNNNVAVVVVDDVFYAFD